MTDNKGLYDKFHVSRTDGDPTGKHANCGYFVLDPAHDPAAFAAANVLRSANDLKREW